MKYSALLLLLVVVACSQPQVVTPVESDYVVTIRTVDDILRVDEEIELVSEIMNKSEHSVMILHSSPLIHVQIYDEQNKPLINMFATDSIGLSQLLKPNELYDPDSERYSSGRRTILIEKPGRYQLVGTATFSTETDNGERKDYRIVSEPFEINVE